MIIIIRELKNLGNMKVTAIPVVIGVLDTVTKGLIQRLVVLEIKQRMKTTQTTTLLGSVRILRRVLETCSHSDSSRKQSANAGMKNSQMSKMIIMINKRKRKERWIFKSCKRSKKLCTMKVMVIPIVIDALGTIPKGLIKDLGGLEIRGQVETIQTIWLRSARIQRRVLKP